MNAKRCLFCCLALLGAMWLGCDSSATEPENAGGGDAADRHFTRDDLHPEGDVTETTNGYDVNGALHVDTDEGQTSVLNAELNVEFNEDGYVEKVSGKTEVPPPSTPSPRPRR